MVLCCCRAGSATVSDLHCNGSVPILQWYCDGTLSATVLMNWRYNGSAMGMHPYCTETVLILHRHRTGAVWMLCRYCIS